MSNLSLSRSLEILERLKGVLVDFAGREEKLVRSLHHQQRGIERRFGTEGVEEDLAGELAQAQAGFAGEEARLRQVMSERRSRIERLRGQELRLVPKRAREAREARLGHLQGRLRRAEQQQADDLEAATVAHNDFTDRLTAEHGRVVRWQREARRALGRRSFGKAMEAAATRDAGSSPTDRQQLYAHLQGELAAGETRLQEWRGSGLAHAFEVVPLWGWMIAVLLLQVVVSLRYGLSAGLFAAGGYALVAALYATGRVQAGAASKALAAVVTRVQSAFEATRLGSVAQIERGRAEIEQTFQRTHAEISAEWNRADTIEAEAAEALRREIEEQVGRLRSTLTRLTHPRLKALTAERFRRMAEIEQVAKLRHDESVSERERELAHFANDETTRWDALEKAWREATEPLFAQIGEMNLEAGTRFPAWSESGVEQWQPAPEFPVETKFAQLEINTAELVETQPRDPRLGLPGPAQFALPLALNYPQQGSLLFETNSSAGALVSGCLNNVILRLLASAPPGKISFTIVDPVGLGQNFAGLMHLSDYEESLINRRIWTQSDQIEARLGELNEHIEKVIQMYLRNEYATITEYNAKAGSVAEKYHFLVAADFPAGFSETAARRLQSIATSGPRCGVFTLLHWDRRRPLPEGLVAEELRRHSVVLAGEPGRVALASLPPGPGTTLVLDAPAAPEVVGRLLHLVGQGSIDSGRVEVPFTQIAPPPGALWQSETTSELRVPIGRTGATKLQYLAIGKGTRQHALFAGKTGSGKSTLFHVIITNLALWCSPEQVEFYLIDFKKGVEFKCYAEKRLPHARVVAIESDREFALSVLQRVDEELRRRGDLFRKLGVQDIAGYARVTARVTAGQSREPMPRTLLIIDEFQEFFVEDDTIAQSASLLFDRIVRQGRAFGIHVLLGSQTLGGAYTLARATLGQMVIRVALQCNEADAYLIMDENNAAPRLLSRPGEGIYNDAAGASEGNSPFQVVWLADEERDRWLNVVRERAAAQEIRYPAPIVFEGNSPAEVRENELIQRLLTGPALPVPAAPRCWLGAPNSIKGPTEAVFHRQSGNNLLIVGQREEAALTMLGLALLALAAQFPAGGARFVFFLSAAPGSPEAHFIEQIADARPGMVRLVTPPETAEGMAEISAELKKRLGNEEGNRTEEPAVFVFVQGLHKFKKLRPEDEFSFSGSFSDEEGGAPAPPGAQFHELMLEGAAHGLHLLASVDSFSGVNRFISRKALSEWEMRVVFQMSANDSASLIDSPQASNLGLHRALFYNERAGSLETFRPYALPDEGWLAGALKLGTTSDRLVSEE